MQDQQWLVLLRKILGNFVDRELRIRSHTIHEITLSYTKEHEIKGFGQGLPLVSLAQAQGTDFSL